MRVPLRSTTLPIKVHPKFNINPTKLIRIPSNYHSRADVPMAVLRKVASHDMAVTIAAQQRENAAISHPLGLNPQSEMFLRAIEPAVSQTADLSPNIAKIPDCRAAIVSKAKCCTVVLRGEVSCDVGPVNEPWESPNDRSKFTGSLFPETDEDVIY